MTDSHHSPVADQLDDYLDGLMNPAERDAFEAALREDAELQRTVALQGEVDGALAGLFPRQTPPPAHIEAIRGKLAAKSGTLPFDAQASLRHRRYWLTAVAAATLAGITVAWWSNRDHVTTPFFEPTPVAQLYREAVRNGFEPYYECRDADRFAATFQRRQDKPLELLPLPSGSRMLGLSYPGGLSRDTTAMLGSVDDQPVMVFVDRIEVDNALAQRNQEPALHVFREARDGLVFYEVTPFPEPRMTEYLVVAP